MSLIKLKNTEIKEAVTNGETDILSINLKYPSFEGENQKVCYKLCGFYSSAAAEYLKFCKTKFAPLLLKKSKNGGVFRKNGASMSWYVSFLNENILSLLTDTSFFDGETKKSARYIHNWNLNDCSIIYAKKAFNPSRAAKELYLDEICSKISNGDGGFGYFSDAEKIARNRFDFENFYFTAKGIAFYYNKGVISGDDTAYPAFIIPYSEVEGITQMYRNI